MLITLFVDNYDLALSKLKKAEDTSDLNSVSESEELATQKRKIVKPTKFISSDDEDDSELLRPPPIKRKIFKGETTV